jgi:uncharacterized membrane protein
LHTKNPILGVFLRALHKMDYVGIFYCHLVYFVFVWYLYFVLIWYILCSFGIFPRFDMLCEAKSGIPEMKSPGRAHAHVWRRAINHY